MRYIVIFRMEGKFPSGEDQEKIEVDSRTYSELFEYAFKHESKESDRLAKAAGAS